MTMGFWICDNCGYRMDLFHVSMFIEECPECNIKYIELGKGFGFHICHTIVFYIMEGEDIKDFKTNNAYAFAYGTGKKHVWCYDDDFYEFLKKNHKNISIEKIKK